jgi:hypothetical protein
MHQADTDGGQMTIDLTDDEAPVPFSQGSDMADVIRIPIALPIATAPAVPGEEGAPCLLYAPGEANWTGSCDWELGYWNGEGWFSFHGLRVHPTHWAPLPEVLE